MKFLANAHVTPASSASIGGTLLYDLPFDTLLLTQISEVPDMFAQFRFLSSLLRVRVVRFDGVYMAIVSGLESTTC